MVSSTLLTVRGRRIAHNAKGPGGGARSHFQRSRFVPREPQRDAARPALEAAGVDRGACAGHELSVPVQVVEREQSQAQDLADEVQVTEVGARVALGAASAGARDVDRTSIVLVASLLDDDPARPGEGLTV